MQALETATFPLAQSTPDPESLVVGQGVVEAIRLDRTNPADALRLTCGPTLLGEEGLWIGVQAAGFEHPHLIVVVECQLGAKLTHRQHAQSFQRVVGATTLAGLVSAGSSHPHAVPATVIAWVMDPWMPDVKLHDRHFGARHDKGQAE